MQGNANGVTDMTKKIGQTYMAPNVKQVAEIVKITKSGRIKYELYSNGEKWNATWTVAETTFNRDYPVFIANA